MMAIDQLAVQRAEFVSEFGAIEDQVLHACTELGKVMHAYQLNAGPLLSAQDHALASTKALRNVAKDLGRDGRPRPASPTRPQDCAASLADQLATQRVAVVQVLALVQHLPGIDPAKVGMVSSEVARWLHTMERAARSHQPSKARQ